MLCYYGFGLSLDTRDSNAYVSDAYVSHAKRTLCYAKTATFPRANFIVWSYGYLRSSTNRKHFHAVFYVVQHDVCRKNKITKPRSWAAYDHYDHYFCVIWNFNFSLALVFTVILMGHFGPKGPFWLLGGGAILAPYWG